MKSPKLRTVVSRLQPSPPRLPCPLRYLQPIVAPSAAHFPLKILIFLLHKIPHYPFKLLPFPYSALCDCSSVNARGCVACDGPTWMLCCECCVVCGECAAWRRLVWMLREWNSTTSAVCRVWMQLRHGECNHFYGVHVVEWMLRVQVCSGCENVLQEHWGSSYSRTCFSPCWGVLSPCWG